MRFLGPLIFGVLGTAVLVGLGVWQLQRLAWKESVLAEIEARIGAAPVELPAEPKVADHKYLPVEVEGAFTGEALRVLVSAKHLGAGHRMVSVFQTGERRILVDVGFVSVREAFVPLVAEGARVIGNVHWPDEVDFWTPEPDLAEGLFFARDVPVMADHLGTEPVLIVAQSVAGSPDPAAPMPMPVTSVDVPNNHLGYAIQWFGLAVVWLGMTLFLLWRIRKREM